MLAVPSRVSLTLLLVAWAGLVLACDRGGGGEAAETAPPSAAESGEVTGDGEGSDQAGLPPQITAEHPVPSPGAPGALRSGEAVSFLDGGGEAEAVPAPELHLAVADLAASAAFYEDVLGFAVEAATPDEPPYRRVELAREGVRIVLRRSADLAAELPRTIGSAAEEEARSGPAPATGAGSGTATAPGTGIAGPSSVLHVPATDVDALLRRVEQAGTGTARLDEAPDGSRRLSVRAPDGNVLVFVESLGPDPGD